MMFQRFSMRLRSGDEGGHCISRSSLMFLEAKNSLVSLDACDGALSCIKKHFDLKARVWDLYQARKWRVKKSMRGTKFNLTRLGTLNGPISWVIHDRPVPFRLRRQQGGGGVIFWARIVGDKLIGPFRVPDRVKLISVPCIDFLTRHFLAWYKSQTRAFKSK